MCIFLGQKKYGIWGDFSEKFQVLCKNLTKLHDLTVPCCLVKARLSYRLPHKLCQNEENVSLFTNNSEDNFFFVDSILCCQMF
jgi:hypothetical protein